MGTSHHSGPHEGLARSALRERVPTFLRDAFLTSLLLFLLGASLIVVINHQVSLTREQEATEQLKALGRYSASLIDLRAHTWLATPQQTTSQPHQALIERLQKVRLAYPWIKDLFTARFQNGQFSLILQSYDPDSGPPRTSVGDPLPQPIPPDSPEYAAIQSRQTFTTDHSLFHPGSDRLGIFVPLANENPGIRDFLYAEIPDPDAGGLLNELKTRKLALALAAAVSALVGALVFAWRSQSYFSQALASIALRENEELFRSTYELSPVAMCLTDRDGKVRRANKAFCTFTGYSQEALRQIDPSRLVHPDDARRERSQLAELETYQTAQFQSERRYIRQDGTTVWGLVSVAIVRDSDANISLYMTQVVDISDRKRAEDVLRLSEERITLAAEAGKVGTWDYDIPRNAVIWNRVMHAIYHTDAHSFTPSYQSQLDFIHPEDRLRVEDEMRRSLLSADSCQQEYRIQTSSGLRHLKSSAAIFRDSKGRAVRVVGAQTDVTAEKEESQELIRAKEAALAADKAKSEFLAMMSHEIRTPLNGVLGFVSLLKNTPLDSEQLSYVETMESSGQSLLSLVSDVLDLSKIESSEIHVESTTFELRPFIRRIHQQLQSEALRKELDYDFFVEYAVPKCITTDQMRLGQILLNILGNALKFTDRGRVDLHVSAKPSGLFQKNWEWRFTIRDSGPGIPAEAIPHLFQLFYQADSSATRRHGGTGLGLAISQRLARLLGGEITATSHLGEGSEFTLILSAPRAEPISVPAPAAIVAPPRPSITTPAEAVRGKRILVVEDNPINRKLCALQLQRLGCETDFAESGLEAVEKVRTQAFDAVLMDMQLPDLDGCDTTRRIRDEIQGGARLSIIALTANAMPEDRKRCLDAGMNDFLSKPLQYEALATTLSKWV